MILQMANSFLLWKTIPELTGFLESECEVALNLFKENKMIVNPGKFQAIIIDK